MTFREGARNQPGRVSVGGRGGGGRGKLAIGGGAGGLVIIVLVLLFGGDPSQVLGQLSGGTDNGGGTQSGSGIVENCETGSDANANVDCLVDFTVSSLDLVWEAQLGPQTGVAYVQP
ncbi:MAG: neutral zinc metallopeptidase, partial [Rhodococcus sp. (in: high G+C Gram-positive bacteria)]